MKPPIIRLMAALVLSLTLISPPAKAQPSDPFFDLAPTIGPELPKMLFTTLLGTFVDRNCDLYTKVVGISYPINTGSSAFDNFLADKAKKDFDMLANETNGECFDFVKSSRENWYRLSFIAHAPGKNHVSVMFVGTQYGIGGAHPINEASSYIYDLRSGKFVKISDVFEDPQKSLPLLWPKIEKAWCALMLTLTSYYSAKDYNYCIKNIRPMPKRWKSGKISFEDMGYVFLTPKGMLIHELSPFSQAIGPQEITIPKRDLLTMGVKKGIWD
jgi:hypothetical protein